jgi:hypothetical protein
VWNCSSNSCIDRRRVGAMGGCALRRISCPNTYLSIQHADSNMTKKLNPAQVNVPAGREFTAPKERHFTELRTWQLPQARVTFFLLLQFSSWCLSFLVEKRQGQADEEEEEDGEGGDGWSSEEE